MHVDTSPSVERVRILVVDDQRENRVALRAILAGQAYELFEAADANEALRHLLAADFAAILLDVVMPDVDGFELAALIKQRARTAATPIIFLTGFAVDEATLRRAYRLGAVDYLVKPLMPEVVRGKIAVFAELYRQRQRIAEQAEQLLEAERRQGEDRLDLLRAASERRYRNLAEAVPHIVWTAGPDGQLDYRNRRWYQFTGLKSDSQDGWLGAVHPDDRDRVEQAWQAARRDGSPLEVECRLRCAGDGGYRWQLCRALAERSARGEVASWLGTFTDIDDHKRIQVVLAELKGMLDAVLDAVLIFDAGSGRMVYVNDGAASLLGYRHEELMAAAPAALMPALAEEDLGGLLAPTADGRMTCETHCRRKDGSEVPVELALQLVGSDETRIIAIARNVSARKQEEALREFLYRRALDAVKARDEFLSIASHELRTPLTSLHLQVESLMRLIRRGGTGDKPAPPELLSTKLDVAARQVRRLVSLIDELLDVSRITSGQFRIDRDRVELAALVRDVADRFADDARKAACPVAVELPPDPVWGEWDRVRLEQVVTNLFTNALKFGAGRPVEMRVTVAEALARVSVRDHGIGIPEEVRQRIFDRFERGTAGSGFGGLGLGLYIAQRIVLAHEGRIQLSSTPGEGAEFIIELPLRAASGVVASERSVAAEAALTAAEARR